MSESPDPWLIGKSGNLRVDPQMAIREMASLQPAFVHPDLILMMAMRNARLILFLCKQKEIEGDNSKYQV